MANQWLIVGLVVSIALNVFAVLFLVGTGIGKEMFKRFSNWIKIKRGGYANTLLLTKNGKIREEMKKVDDHGKFEIDGTTYVRDPNNTFFYWGIPTHLHLEDQPDAVKPFKKWTSNEMSSGELDDVMMAMSADSLLDDLKEYAPYVIGAVVLLAGALAAVAYLNWQVYDVIVQEGVGEISSRAGGG
jgi:hypothetical protein